MAYRTRHHRLVGTVVDIVVDGTNDDRLAARAERSAVARMARLEAVLSAFSPDSELERWKRGEVRSPSPELCAVMALALAWQDRSGGAFNPAVGELSQLWAKAEVEGRPPPAAALTATAEAIRAPRYAMGPDGVPRPRGNCAALNFNALAKGWIVDRALDAALAVNGTLSVLVNAGGDVAHRGQGAVAVGVEDPLRPYDNEPPLDTVWLAGAGLATSGRARKGFRVGTTFYGHVLDPRTGAAADHIASITVVAGDCATADVLATVAGLRQPSDAVGYTASVGAACLVVAPDGARTANEAWAALRVPPS